MEEKLDLVCLEQELAKVSCGNNTAGEHYQHFSADLLHLCLLANVYLNHIHFCLSIDFMHSFYLLAIS